MSASSSGRLGPDVRERPSSSPTDRQFAANLQLPRGSVITGTVVDEYGEPTPGTQVRVMRYVVQAGRRTLQQTGSGATDDRGIYRVYGLQPGEYIVSAVPRNVGPGVDVGRLQAELAQVREQVAGALADAAAARDLATRATMLQGQMPAQEEQSHRLRARVFSGHGQPRVRPAPSRSISARNAPASTFSCSASRWHASTASWSTPPGSRPTTCRSR